MKKIVALGVLLCLLGAMVPVRAEAGGAAVSVALGLASFAVFNQLVFGLFVPPVWARSYVYPAYYYPPVVYAPPPVSYYPPPAPYYAASPAVVYASAPRPAPTVAYASPRPAPAPPSPPVQNQVVYPHGKYVLKGDGVTTAYQWVWIPNAPQEPAATTQLQVSPASR